ncbi:hypothetical protein GBA52_016323 [Prunus armeniaca]|nr:hypothetical protein GBA52_016323 [Prunus armeniaca]
MRRNLPEGRHGSQRWNAHVEESSARMLASMVCDCKSADILDCFTSKEEVLCPWEHKFANQNLGFLFVCFD